MAGTASADAIWKDMQARGVEFVFAQFVDMYARPSAKLVPVGSREAFDGLLDEGAGFAGFAAGEIGQVPSDPDIAAIPDLASYTPVPWQSNLARLACDVTVEGGSRMSRLVQEPVERLPRTDGHELRARPGVHVDELREHELDAARLHVLPDRIGCCRPSHGGSSSDVGRIALPGCGPCVKVRLTHLRGVYVCGLTAPRAWWSFTIFTAISIASQSSLRRSSPESSPIRRRR